MKRGRDVESELFEQPKNFEGEKRESGFFVFLRERERERKTQRKRERENRKRGESGSSGLEIDSKKF